MKQLLGKTNLELKLALGFSAICFFDWATIPNNAAGNSEETQQELAAVFNAIGEIQSWLSEANSTQSIEIQNLQQADLQISKISQSVTETQTVLAVTESEISSLSREADQLRSKNSAKQNSRTGCSHCIHSRE